MPHSRHCFIISLVGQPDSAVRNHADDVYRFIIRPALEAFGIIPERSDDISEGGRITEQMFERIFRADVCVSVLSGFNPNVFCELAVAQCAARPTVLLIEQGQILPFYVKDLRTIHYQLQPISRSADQPISRLVDGHYVRQVGKQLADIAAHCCNAAGLFEQFSFALRLQIEQQVRHLLTGARPETLPEMADCHFATSLSGKLRYLDAEKSAGGRLSDGLREQPQAEIAARQIVFPAAPGTAIPTRPHRPASHGVKAVFHLAGTEGVSGDGYSLLDDAIDYSVHGVFDVFAQQSKAMHLQTLFMPMILSFMTQLEQTEVVRRILRIVLIKMERVPACRPVFLLAWIESQRSALHRVADGTRARGVACATDGRASDNRVRCCGSHALTLVNARDGSRRSGRHSAFAGQMQRELLGAHRLTV